MRAHLKSYRSGWQSENLARYILSNFAFISQPSTIADDIGADFFCTIFDDFISEKKSYLIPKESFAIQIKSDSTTFSIDGKAQYLKGLGIPFFVGVVDKNKQELEIFSGEYLLPFFADKSKADKIKIKICEVTPTDGPPYSENGEAFTVCFPKIVTIGTDPTLDDFSNKIQVLSKACKTINGNITRRNNKELIFADSFSRGFIMVGDEQIKQESLSHRLLKIRIELSYILDNNLVNTKLDIYQKIKDALMKI